MRNVYYAALSCLIVAAVLSVCYNLFVHRLRFVPGPRRHAISRIPYIYATLTGQLPFLLHRLHEKYGPVVRTAPNEVSFIDQGALRTLHTHKNAVTSHIFPKNYDAWSETSNYFANTIFLTGKDDDHARMRKVFGAAFSEQMLREHESTIAKAVDCFVEQLREDFASSQDAPGHLFTVDLNKRLHWLAFDIASEFVFGLNFDCVRSPVYRTWLHKLSCTWTFIAIISSLKQLVAISAQLLRPFGLLQSRVDALSLLDSRSEELMDKSALKPTLLSVGRMCVKDDKITRQEPGTITRLELIANVSLFTVAGTDTVATVMPSVVFLLLSHPNAMECLLRELRNIPQEKDITYQRLSEIHYLTACIQEAMRLHPPVPEGLPRVVPGVGAEICGHWVPPGTAVQISTYAAYRSPANFDCPDSFVPERWMPGSVAAKRDKGRDVFLPFSTGPRGCIGQNFAMAEIRMLLAKLLWNFELSLVSERDWMDQRCFLLWERKPLHVTLVPKAEI